MIVVFDPAAFRTAFPAFAADPPNTDALLNGYFASATTIISAEYSGCLMLTGDRRVRALYLLTAHIAALAVLIADGQTPGYETSATVDKVSVTVEPPPNKTQFQWWLSTTPYGAELSALLSVAAVGGIYVGGMPERSAFRRVGGGFNGPLGRWGC